MGMPIRSKASLPCAGAAVRKPNHFATGRTRPTASSPSNASRQWKCRKMPSYVRSGSLPHKRHIQFRRPDGGLYAEELFSTKGFESVYSLLYHLRPPTATLDVRAWQRPEIRFFDNDQLRNRHFKTHHLEASGRDAIETRMPLLGNADLLLSVAQADVPMEY